MIEQLSERLLLRQDDPALGRSVIDRDHQDHGVPRLDQIRDDILFLFLVPDDMGELLLERVDPRTVDRADIDLLRLRCGDDVQQIDLVIHDEIRQPALAKFRNKRVVRLSHPERTVYHQHGDIRLSQHLAGTLYPQRAEGADVVKAGRVDDHDRSQRQQLHRFFDRIGRRTKGIGNDRYFLIGHSVHDAGFAGVAPPEKGDMRTLGRYGCIQ